MIPHMVEFFDRNRLSRHGGHLQEPTSATIKVRVNCRELAKDSSFDFFEIGGNYGICQEDWEFELRVLSESGSS
jgi:hypothetical protein